MIIHKPHMANLWTWSEDVQSDVIDCKYKKHADLLLKHRSLDHDVDVVDNLQKQINITPYPTTPNEKNLFFVLSRLYKFINIILIVCSCSTFDLVRQVSILKMVRFVLLSWKTK